MEAKQMISEWIKGNTLPVKESIELRNGFALAELILHLDSGLKAYDDTHGSAYRKEFHTYVAIRGRDTAIYKPPIHIPE